MKANLLSLLVLFSLCSCVTNKIQDEVASFSLEIGGEEKINKECEAIKETGDIFTLLWEIKRDTRSVLQTLEQKPYKGMEETIHRLAENINHNSLRVIELTRSEWNQMNVRHIIKWRLSDADFGSRNRYLSDPTVKAVYFLGKEEPALIKRIRIKQLGSDFTIEYVNQGTLLEYCQLNETLMIVLEVKVHSFTGIKKKFFNLNVNLEKIL